MHVPSAEGSKLTMFDVALRASRRAARRPKVLKVVALQYKADRLTVDTRGSIPEDLKKQVEALDDERWAIHGSIPKYEYPDFVQDVADAHRRSK